MSVRIEKVRPFSRCWLHGLRAGDELLSVGGKEVGDVLDYDFFLSFTPTVLRFRKASGKEIGLRTGNKNIGLSFRTFLMDGQRRCKNKCIFCFVDQLPGGLRESLYFKDDDSRLSFLFGTYISLTNLTEREIERIISMRLSPVNVSVHTMNPELRVRMMRNPAAGESLAGLKRLADAGVKINAQLVLCPGINDGDALKYSIEELGKLRPSVQSVACVPVGLTKFRKGLYPLRPYTAKEAGETIDLIEGFAKEFKRRYGIRFCYPSDEFFLKAGRPLPPENYYDDYPQLDNGVGLWTSLRTEFYAALKVCNGKPARRKITLATGEAAYPLMRGLCAAASEKFGVEIGVVKIINRFFGENITVAGLLTGKDLLEQLGGEAFGEALLLPRVTVRDGKFLDDVTLKEAEKRLGVPLLTAPNDGEALLRAILGVK